MAVRKTLIGGAAAAALLLVIPALADDEFEFAPLPPGEGAEETFYNCSGCHSLKTVTNGAYSRRVWDEILDWMVEDQGMWELDPEERELILDYLATHLGEDRHGR